MTQVPDKIPKSTSDVHLLASLPLLPVPIGAEPLRNVLDAFGSAVAVQVAEILGLPLSDPNDLLRSKTVGSKIKYEFKINHWIQPAKAEGSLVKFEMDSQTLCRTVSHQVNELPHLSAKEIGGGCGINSSGINPSTGKKKKVVLEFSSPNIAKKIMQHLLDVYTKINKDMEGEEKAILGQKAHDFFKSMEEGDPKPVALWEQFRDYSIKQYKQDYAGLHIKFDVYSGQSQVSHESMNVALKLLKEKGIAIKYHVTLICDLNAYKLGRTIIRKRDGTNLYITRDIREAIQRYEKYKFDKMIHVVASRQDLHLAQFVKVLDRMGA
ncbi:hypothetical protein MJO28_010959 [Puccinia striiformis f. sp. tritici]|uniref:Arginyl-tRNA synthetase catalytic core domain-containing protein n=3 Tax=Puccinia striiformis f. sp. tritici TaxID=168172 RepID=A0A0L0V9E5_9BASI|nr:hypothetical protein MJO28_010959 [Puccinia striiformis f. sp. tritici]KAI9619044.1 hypothetical protein KEM48_006401 [Puccinia striiformis f. sp. tritici PST-130]KNE95816.1 hypothetical protein PSTG_10876 [Puccinia striiformis f. sp. tritici PST-78]